MVLETKSRGKKERNEQKTPRINKVRSKKSIQLIRSTMTKKQEIPIQENLRTETTHPQEAETEKALNSASKKRDNTRLTRKKDRYPYKYTTGGTHLQAQYNKPQRDKRGETQSKKTMYKASHIGNRTKEREEARTHKRC